MNTCGCGFDRESRLPSQPHRDGKFVRVVLRPADQLLLSPPKSPQFLGDKPVGLGLRGFQAQLARVVSAQAAFHPLQLLLAKRLAAQAPSLQQRLQPLRVSSLQTPSLHVALKFLARQGRVLL